MFIRPCYRVKNGKRHAYWALVESVRTERGPRQQVVAYLGQAELEDRLAMERAAKGAREIQRRLDEPEVPPQWVMVDARRVHVARCLEFGGPWLGRELLRELGLTEFLGRVLPPGQEDIPWSVMAQVPALCRFCGPSSELYVAEHFYRRTALGDVLGVPAEKVNEQRPYRAMDQLLPHKDALQTHLKNRLGELFELEYDLLLYDVTSTYFEGQANGNPQARRGYSRDHRGDCKQVCIGLVVSRCGMPLGHEVFDGNRTDVTTFQEIIATMEGRYGQARRIWVVDRGMVSQDNIEFLQAGHRRYIIGTPKSLLKQFQRQLLTDDWQKIREELWKAYMQLTEAEGAFRIHKSDLSLRPIWHQKQDRVQAHILVCFLAHVLWKTLGQLCHRAGLGEESRRVLDELRKIRVVDVVLPTRSGMILCKRCITRPTDHQAILLQRLGLHLPSRLEMTDEMQGM
jgi:hypothetical protein